MTQITVQFNLPEDVDDWNMYKRMTTYYLAVEDIRAEIRSILKYQPELSDDTEMTLRNLQLLLPEDE